MTITPIQIRWNDIDMLGHVYNGQYQHFFDVGKSDFFASALHAAPDWLMCGQGLLTAQTLNNYYAPTTIDEQIAVVTSLEKIGNKSFTLFQQLKNTTTGAVKADSRSVLVCYDPAQQCSVEIFADWLPLLQAELKKSVDE